MIFSDNVIFNMMFYVLQQRSDENEISIQHQIIWCIWFCHYPSTLSYWKKHETMYSWFKLLNKMHQEENYQYFLKWGDCF